jgi:site-specific DNA recombinase
VSRKVGAMAERAGIWLRVGTGGQDEVNQEPDVLRYCADRGYEVVKTYTVHGKSAYKGDQDPDWQRVVKDVKSGKISVVVVWNVDRLDRRNIMHAIPMVNAVLDIDGRIEFATQSIDLTTMEGRIGFAIYCEQALAESKIKSGRVLAKHNALRAVNAFVGRPPFGYRIVCAEGCGPVNGKHEHPKTLEPDPALVPYVKGMAERYLTGSTLTAICEWLDAEGVKPSGGGMWQPRTVRLILGSPTLVGRRKHGGGVIRYEPILDTFTFRRLQDRLTANPRRPVVSADAAAFAGIIYCAKCGRIMHRRIVFNTRKDGSRQYNYYYRCDGTSRELSTCRNMLPMAELDATVEASFAAEFGDKPWPERVPNLAEDYSQDLEDVKQALNDLMTAWNSDLISDDDYDARFRELRAERDRLLKAERDRLAGLPLSANGEGKTLGQRWAELDAAGKRELLHDIGLKVLAGKDQDGAVAIEWATAEGETDQGVFVTYPRPWAVS